ncbi:MAG: signal peptidase I [Eubacteriales bacterium]|nr:signal peptidase I [Eubacteriales bacterium]
MQTDNGKKPETSETEEKAQVEASEPVESAETEAKAETAEVTGEAVPTKEKKKKKVKKEILSWILTLGSAVVIALLIRTFLFEPIRVDGQSMCDTLQDKEIMFVTKPEYIFGEPQRGDVVICKYPGRTENFVKRLMGVPGDTLEIRDNVVYLNGEALDEPYLTPTRNDDGFSMDAITLEDGQYFVMGDNRDNSHDCRNYYGYGKPTTLSRSQIIGHVRCVLFPFSDIRGIE